MQCPRELQTNDPPVWFGIQGILRGGGGGDTESEDRMQRDEVTLLGKELLGDEMIRVRRQCNNKHTAPGPFPGDSDSVGGAHGKSGFPFKFLSWFCCTAKPRTRYNRAQKRIFLTQHTGHLTSRVSWLHSWCWHSQFRLQAPSASSSSERLPACLG